jgi:hypothetical protein
MDIVERLRADRFEYNGDLDLEAADEITRLREENAELLSACIRALNYAENVGNSEGVYFDDDDDLPAIRAVVDSVKGGCVVGMVTLGISEYDPLIRSELISEIQRLRKECDELLALLKTVASECEKKITTLREKLKVAEEGLKKIADLRNLGKTEPEVVAFEALAKIRDINDVSV